jgi:replicative DNA helicase
MNGYKLNVNQLMQIRQMVDTRFQSEKNPSLYKVPPQNLEAEESILSAILIDNTTFLDVVEILSPEDFYRSSHNKIFSAMLDLFSKSEPIDLVTLANILKEQNYLEKIGGATYLARLVDTVPVAVNARHYARIIHDKASLRRLIEKTNEIARQCFEDRGDVDELIDFAERAIARNAAVNANVPVAIFSLEMSKEQLSMRLLCAEARIDSHRIKSGFFSRDDWNRLTEAAGVLSEAPIYIDDSPDISATSIRAKARRLKMDKGLGLVIVDYLQLMRGRASNERRDLEISEISRSLKALAKEVDVPVLALSQLNRKLEERSDKRPQLSDLRESGALEQDADVVAFIYRDEVYNKDENNPNKGKAEIILSKQRNGPIGWASLTFLTSYTRFENPASEDDYGMMDS